MIGNKMLWPALLTASLGSGALTGWLTATASHGSTPEQPGLSTREATLANRVEELTERLVELEARPAARAADPATARQVVSASVDEARLRELIAEALAESSGSSAHGNAEDHEASTDRQLPESARDAVAQMLELGIQSAEARALWKQAHEQGRLDELLAAFESWAKEQPESADVQADLARAYSGAAQQEPNHPNGTWWIASDDAYSAALELDSTHWDARIEKAVSLTHWPDVWGRRPEAMQHFETLIEQARTAPVADEKHARPFLWLGNLHSQDGNYEEAGRVWSEGLRRFPDDSDLLKQLEKY